MSVISAGLIFTSSGAGIVADKLGLVKTLFLCSALYLASFILLPASASIVVICIALILMSIGNANTSVFAPMVTARCSANATMQQFGAWSAWQMSSAKLSEHLFGVSPSTSREATFQECTSPLPSSRFHLPCSPGHRKFKGTLTPSKAAPYSEDADRNDALE